MFRLQQEEAREWAAMHPPEVMRRGSNVAHWIIGAVLGVAAIIASVQAFDIIADGPQRYLWPAFLLLAGSLLSAIIFFHQGPRKVVSRPRRPGSIALAGPVEILRTAGSLSTSAWAFVLPVVFFVVGALFVLHPQHGTAEAARKAVRYHRVLGAVLIVVSILRSLEVLSTAAPAYLWAVTMLVASGLLVAYREPEGAYEKPHDAHVPTRH